MGSRVSSICGPCDSTVPGVRNSVPRANRETIGLAAAGEAWFICCLYFTSLNRAVDALRSLEHGGEHTLVILVAPPGNLPERDPLQPHPHGITATRCPYCRR